MFVEDLGEGKKKKKKIKKNESITKREGKTSKGDIEYLALDELCKSGSL